LFPGPRAFHSGRRQVRVQREQLQLLGRGPAGPILIGGERPQHPALRAAQWDRPHGAPSIGRDQGVIRRPVGVGPQILGDDNLASPRRDPARTSHGPDRKAVDGRDVVVRDADRRGMAHGAALVVEQEQRVYGQARALGRRAHDAVEDTRQVDLPHHGGRHFRRPAQVRPVGRQGVDQPQLLVPRGGRVPRPHDRAGATSSARGQTLRVRIEIGREEAEGPARCLPGRRHVPAMDGAQERALGHPEAPRGLGRAQVGVCRGRVARWHSSSTRVIRIISPSKSGFVVRRNSPPGD